MPGKLAAAGPGDVNPKDYDLVALAMQEPQYRSPGVRELLDAVARSRVPCMSIMNMPPLPYLKRIAGLKTDALKPAFTDASVWDNFEPGHLTLCSPDPQAIRPPGEKINVLQVTLPTNFKVARFDSDKSTAILREMEADIEAARYDPGDGPIQLPVKLKVHDSIFVPLAKWAMLLTGNYRCVTKDGAIDIKDAVHNDLEHVDARSTIGSAAFASGSAHRPTTWCHSRNTLPPQTTWCGRPRPPGPSTTAPPISSGRTGSCS